MAELLRPLLVLLSWYATLVNRRLVMENEYLKAENRILHRQLGKKRLLLTVDEKRELVQKAMACGRKALDGLISIVTVDTLLRWHKKLIALKHTYVSASTGRPRKSTELRNQTLRMARENPQWGYDRIAGALQNLGHEVCAQTVGNILRANGVKPAPNRKSTWRQFLQSHAASLVAMDFFTTEVWTLTGLRTYYTLFAIDLKTRAVEFVGTTTNPDGGFMAQVARNMTGVMEGWLKDKRLLLSDNDKKYTAQFRRILNDAGLRSLKLPSYAPDANAFAERFVRSVKSECLERLILFGEGALRRALGEYLAHYNGERNHQGIGNVLIAPLPGDLGGGGRVAVRRRLGGLLNFYRCKAG
jgi:putative transposase